MKFVQNCYILLLSHILFLSFSIFLFYIIRSTNDNSSDEEEEEEEERETGGSSTGGTLGNQDSTTEEAPSGDKRPVPLVDYVLNVMKFVDAILSNNSTDDHCKEFVSQKGLVPLLGILGLPNLPIDFPVSQACQSVASVCKSILVSKI